MLLEHCSNNRPGLGLHEQGGYSEQPLGLKFNGPVLGEALMLVVVEAHVALSFGIYRFCTATRAGPLPFVATHTFKDGWKLRLGPGGSEKCRSEA